MSNPVAVLVKPPRDPLRYVFTRETIESWLAVKNPSRELRYRIKTAEASGPFPTDIRLARDLRYYRAHKVAWHAYIYSAFACGMFDSTKGKDLLRRLRSNKRDQFRPALAECMVCWFLAGRMRLSINTCAPGRGNRMLEMKIVSETGDTGVEVKAPFEELPELPSEQSSFSHVNEAQKLVACMDAANKQFDNATPNLLVIVPSLGSSVVQMRNDIVGAAYGESKITTPFNPETGSLGDVNIDFFPEGRFLETMRTCGKPLKPDGLPAYRRISAILCIEERIMERYPRPFDDDLLENLGLFHSWLEARQRYVSSDNDVWIDHDAIMLHNPHAYHALPQETWRAFPQLIPVDDRMEWSDNYPINV